MSIHCGEEISIPIRSKDPKIEYTCSPGLCVCPNGRLVATGGLRGPLVEKEDGHLNTAYHYGKVFVSDDRGETWRHIVDYPYRHARPFMAGDSLYILGHEGDLMVMRSDDLGETWSEPVKLTEGKKWHQAPCNVWYANGCVYLVMEQQVHNIYLWQPSVLAPVLMRAKIGDDLTKLESWTFAEAQAFCDAVDVDAIKYAGMPMLREPSGKSFDAKTELNGPMGWLEANVVQVMDSKHWWYDASGKTFHVFMRYHWGGTGYAALLKVVEQGAEPGTGSMKTMFETMPSGEEVMFLPMPVGHLKFHMLYDEQTRLYWLLGSQAKDNVMAYDRERLVLYFSKNLMGWCFAGLVSQGASWRESRSYASMVVDGEDLQILSRSGSPEAKSAHDGDLITFHTVRNFRNLVY
jgi:hypothetical protein